MISAGENGTQDDEDRLDLDESHVEAGGPAAPTPPASDQLAFGDDDVRLPWLQSDDDDEDDYQGYSSGQMISLVLLGLLALGLIVGGIWWATRERPDDVLVADGGVIEAPAPYKERPKNPGGKTFEGTGDTSFPISEGESRPIRLGPGTAGKADTDTAGPAVPKGTTSTAATAAATGAAAPAAGGIGVQVGAFSTRASAEAGWTRLSQQNASLAGVPHRVIEGRADIGTVYRLQAVANDAAAANALCRGLRGAGVACQVKN